MARRARIRIANVPWHVIQRGNNRQRCFFASSDYVFYLEQLDALSRKFGCAIHAYVLMSNHVHLLLTPVDAQGVSLMMKNLGQQYVQAVNRVHQRTGSLWEGRFRSSLIETGDYLFTCYRYIELNPVRAGMVRLPRDYPWSSFRANAEGKATSFLQPHENYLQLGETPEERRRAYRGLFGTELDPVEIDMIRGRTNGGFVIGSKTFRERLSCETGRQVDPLAAGRRPAAERVEMVVCPQLRK